MDHVPAADIAFDRHGHDLVVDIVGELDAATAPECSRRIAERIRPDDEAVWLNLRCVSVCTPDGVSMITDVHHKAVDRGGHAVVYRPSIAVLRALRMHPLDDGLLIRTA